MRLSKNNKNSIFILIISILSSYLLCGCDFFSKVNGIYKNENIESKLNIESDVESDIFLRNKEESENDSYSNINKKNNIPFELMDVIDGKNVIIINNNFPNFSDEEIACVEPFEIYGDLDSLGRCTYAYANICIELMPTEPRGEIGNIRPTGWHTIKYSDIIEERYLYNRCHLIGYQLSGENANEKNLITGTRYLNITEMLPFENMVKKYIEETNNHVLYRVTPVFENENLVATGICLEAWSVEDEGKGICFNVFCYNIQPGIDIDYLTGESHAIKSSENGKHPIDNSKIEKIEISGNDSENSSEIEELDYIVNINTKKIHLSTCDSVKDIADHNRKVYSGTIAELKMQGYVPCKRCIDK